VQFPAAAPISIKPRTSLCSRVPKTQLAWDSTRAACQFPFWGRGRQVMHLPCKQAHAGALPADSTNFNCGENEIQARPITSAFVGATPTPATNLGRCSGCRSVKPASQTTVGSDDWSITRTFRHFGSVTQLAEQPVVCGKAEGASPFGSAIFQRVA
jgi:hypothetical protein